MNEPQKVAALRIGDLVVCRESDWQQSMKLPTEPGLIVGTRKDAGKVFFPTIFGEAWVPLHSLARIRNPMEATGLPQWMQRVWYLARTLEAVKLEIEQFGPQGNAVRVYHGEVEITHLDAIRHDLGEELQYYSLSPAGMHKMESSIAYIVNPDKPPLEPRPQELD